MLALLSCVSAEYCKESGVPPKARQVVYACDFGADALRTMTSKATNDAAMAHFIGIVTFPPPQRNTAMRPARRSRRTEADGESKSLRDASWHSFTNSKRARDGGKQRQGTFFKV